MNINDIFSQAKEFNVKTPKGNYIKGLINKKRNRNLGSLWIKQVNGVDVNQYVQGFPKINYWDKNTQLNNMIYGFEKYDGSCICLYPLKNSKGDIIEIVPKSRGLPVVDKNLLNMYNLVEKSNIIEYFKYNKDNQLFFELYGVKNIHSITHMDTYIDLAFIGGVKNISLEGDEIHREFFNASDMANISVIYYLNTPSLLFEIEKSLSNNEYMLILKDDFRKKYAHYYDSKKAMFKLPTVYDCILKIQEILEEVNQNYKKVNNRIATEGVVLNGLYDEYQNYIKIKPFTIKQEAITLNGVPRQFVVKEINKYFDEYGSVAKEEYLNNPDKIWKYVSDNLSEEFPSAVVEDEKTQRRIKKVFVQMADSKAPPESINNIANELIERYPDESIPNLMRIFSQEYPFKKKDARIMYSVLESIKK